MLSFFISWIFRMFAALTQDRYWLSNQLYPGSLTLYPFTAPHMNCPCIITTNIILMTLFLVHIYTARGRMRSADQPLSLPLLSRCCVAGGELITLLVPGVIIAHGLKSSTWMANDSPHTYHNICMHYPVRPVRPGAHTDPATTSTSPPPSLITY